MPVNERLLHNWFYGNYEVRLAAALGFAFLMGSIPIASVAAWLVSELGSPTRRIAALVVLPLNAIKGLIATIIAAHGGGETVGLFAAFAATVGHHYSPWRRFRGGTQIDLETGVVAALSLPSAGIFVAFWAATALGMRSFSAATRFAAALLFFPLWYFLGAPAAFFGIAAGTAIVLRVATNGKALERAEIENLDRPAPARGDQSAFL